MTTKKERMEDIKELLFAMVLIFGSVAVTAVIVADCFLKTKGG